MINLELFANASPAIRAMVRDINRYCEENGIDIFADDKTCDNCDYFAASCCGNENKKKCELWEGQQ